MSFVLGKNKHLKLILNAPQKNCAKNLFGVKRLERNSVRSPAMAGQVYFFQLNAEEIQQLFCRASSGACPDVNRDNFSEFILMYFRKEKLKR